MNNTFSRRFSLLVSLTALTVVSSAMSAQAEVAKSASDETMTPESIQSSAPVATPAKSDSTAIPVANLKPTAVDAKQIPTQEAQVQPSNLQPASPTVAAPLPSTAVQEYQTPEQIAQSKAKASDGDLNTKPVLGNINTSAAALKTEPATFQLPQTTFATSQLPEVTSKKRQLAQTDINVNPGQPTQSGSSYIGIAGNIGLSGDSALSQTNFAVISKIGLTNQFSFRPAAVFGDNTTILLPLTYDFRFKAGNAVGTLPFAPYIGVGAAVQTGGGDDVGFLATGGIDLPLTSKLTATASINADFKSTTDLGLIVGVGYNFLGF
jgi:hypothetical protein